MVNGKLLALMFISGANNLYNNRAMVDELNVFPVPDGDTGTNMSMTANAMAKALTEVQTESVTKVGDIIRSRTFDAFFPLVMVAVLYFIVSWLIAAALDYIGKKAS